MHVLVNQRSSEVECIFEINWVMEISQSVKIPRSNQIDQNILHLLKPRFRLTIGIYFFCFTILKFSFPGILRE